MANSLRESGSILADGTAWLIYTIFFILPPWLVFIVPGFWSGFGRGSAAARPSGAVEPPAVGERRGRTDRKSTRLNSSHGYISYAAFCLKKKQADLFVAIHANSTH